MIQRVMSISTLAKGALGAAALGLCLAAPLAAQDGEPDAEEIAKTPLTDLGISADDIPEVLLQAAKYPYSSDGLTSCEKIGIEIANLDRVLGDDFDVSVPDGDGISKGRVAKSVVGSFIPFRGIVREVSGAAGDARKLHTAVTAGMVRRGFLKGLGQQRGCPFPSRPVPEKASD